MRGAGAPAATQLRDAAIAAKIVYLDTNASTNLVARGNRFTFRVAPSSWQLGEPLGEWAAKNGQRSFFVVNADDAFGTETAAAFIEGLTKSGGAPTRRPVLPAEGGAPGQKGGAASPAPLGQNVFAARFTHPTPGVPPAPGRGGTR